MDINVQVRYFVEEEFTWLCFRCAVKAASVGRHVKTEVDNFRSVHYLGKTWCDHPFDD